MKTLINNILLLPLDGREAVPNACIQIDGNRIAYAGATNDAPVFQAGRTVNGRGRLAMPGLVNAHTHAAMTLLRGLGTDLTLQEWLFETIFPAEDRMTPDDVYWGTMLAHLEMLKFGTTAYLDMYFPEEMTAKAVVDTGIRATLSRGMIGQGIGEFHKIENSIALYNEFHGACNGRIHITFAPHAEYTTSPEYLAKIAEEAAKLSAGIHVHVSETALEHAECVERRGMTPVAYLSSLGLFDGHAVAAHCVHITENDAKILAEKGVYVAHNPVSNLKLGSGVMPLYKELLPRTALGTDGAASNNTLNLFEEVRMAGVIHKGVHCDPTLLPAMEVLQMAAPRGAMALGFPDAGTLAEGKLADIILLDLDAAHAVPMLNVAAHAVYAAQGSDVSLTMVDGEILYEDGNYPTLDAEKIRAEAQVRANRVTGGGGDAR